MPVQFPHSAFAGIILNDLFQYFIADFENTVFQTMLFPLFGQQVSFGNFNFFFHSITAEVNNLQPVAQSGLNILEVIRRCDKKYFTEVILHLQVIIIETMILFRIQYFE